MADVRIVDQPAFNHVPAEHALHATEHKHECILGEFTFLDVTFPYEEKKRQEKYDADRSAKQAMQIFQSLGSSSQVSVTLERNGQPETVVLKTDQLKFQEEETE